MRGAVRLQEGVGLDVITDGEMRRLNFQDSFGAAVEGFDANRSTIKSNERRVEGAAPGQRWEIKEMHNTGTAVSHRRPAKERLKLARNVPLEEYEFVASVAKTPAKVSLIGPDRISQRFDYENSQRRLSGARRFRRRRGQDRARDRREPGEGRLPLHPHRCARFHRLCRQAHAWSR